jgi:predicted transcriptional regulator
LLRRLFEAGAEDPDLVYLAGSLAEAPASAAQLSKVSGLPPAKVRKYLRTLKEIGLIESVRAEGHRGAVEHFYSPTGELVIEADEQADLTEDERRRIYSYLLKPAITEAVASLVSKSSRRSLERLDNPVIRFPMLTDQQGWGELVEIHQECFRKLKEAKERIAARFEEEDEEQFRVTSVVMLFEAPLD